MWCCWTQTRWIFSIFTFSFAKETSGTSCTLSKEQKEERCSNPPPKHFPSSVCLILLCMILERGVLKVIWTYSHMNTPLSVQSQVRDTSTLHVASKLYNMVKDKRQRCSKRKIPLNEFVHLILAVYLMPKTYKDNQGALVRSDQNNNQHHL